MKAIDPVCGEEVEIRDLDMLNGHFHGSEYDGKMYYFCCEDCREEFDESPELYAP